MIRRLIIVVFIAAIAATCAAWASERNLTNLIADNDYKDYTELSGDVVTAINGNYIVPAGKVLNLVGTLNGNLVVRKGATANITATINGNLTNYGTTQIVGTVNGDVTNIGGSLEILGKVNGKVIRK